MAKRILDRGITAQIIEVQSEGEGRPSQSRQRPYPHRACLPSALFVDLVVVCTFGFVIKGAAILTAASCRHVCVAGQGSRAVASKCGFRTTGI